MASRVFDYIAREERRQAETVELIASENFASEAVWPRGGQLPDE